MKKKYVINFFGAPGAGKSTAMAYVYAKLKFAGINCEMCPEHAKFILYEKNKTELSNQVYMFAKQCYDLLTIYTHSDVVITDSPLPTYIVYNNLGRGKEDYTNLILAKFKDFNNINYYLHRTYAYSTFGRYQNEVEADEVGLLTKEVLKKNKINYTDSTSKQEDLDLICEEILKILQKK